MLKNVNNLNPKVSIIMSVYNGAEFLSGSILSILNQSFGDFEFIIVNDASKDTSLSILEEFQKKDQRIKIINNEFNIGLTKSLNRALINSHGEYLARLDSGDISLPERIEMQVNFLDTHKDIGLVGSWMNIINTNGDILKEIKYPVEDKRIRKILINSNPFAHSSIMFRRSMLPKIDIYDEVYRYAQDYKLYFDLFPYMKFANIPKVLVEYRMMPNSITSTKNKDQMKFANNARQLAIKKGYYNVFNYIYVFKYFLIRIIPSKIKFFIKKYI